MRHWLEKYFRWTSWPIMLAMLGLMGVGILAVRTAEGADPFLRGQTLRQAIWVGVSVLAFFAATTVSYQRIGRAAYPLLAVNIALLVLVLFLPPIRYSRRWIDLGLLKFQPSELAKLTYVLGLAWYLRYRQNYRRIVGLIFPLVLTLLPAALIVVEPDLGTTLLLFPTLFVMLFLAGAKVRHLLAIAGAAAAVVLLPLPQTLAGLSPDQALRRKSLAYWSGSIAGEPYVVRAAPLRLLEAHQLRRIEGWLRQSDPAADRDQVHQLRQSKMVLGSGGAAGGGQPGEMNFWIWVLPDDHTDFIYAVVGAQWGFAGCAAVMLMYLLIFVCGAEIAALTHDPFGRLLAVGVLALLFAQIFINVGMTMGLMPITGMTLPLVSYGGSSMVVNAASLGLLVNVAHHRPILLGRRPFEFGRRERTSPAPALLADRGRRDGR